MIRYFTVLSRKRIGKAPHGKEHSCIKLMGKERKRSESFPRCFLF